MKTIKLPKLIAKLTSKKFMSNHKTKIYAGAFGAILLLTILVLVWRKSAVQNNSEVNVQKLVEKVGKLIELPAEERPTVALVSDIEKLKAQTFFAKAQNGDQVLIYASTGKAILYRPSTNKIIEVASLALEATTEPVVPAPAPKITKVVILNGTKKAGIAGTTEAKLLNAIPNLDVILKANTKNDYTKTIVVDLKGTFTDEVTKISSIVGGTPSKLPVAETMPDNADVVVIIGD